jgi:hypothetical protein
MTLALARAERLLQRAEKMCDDIVAVVCRPELARAQRRYDRARRLVRDALDLASRWALPRLGVRGGGAWMRPNVFVDQASWEAIEAIAHGLLMASEYGGHEGAEVPGRGSLEEDLVRGPLATFRELARIARLAPDSPELRAMRASLKGGRRGKKKR